MPEQTGSAKQFDSMGGCLLRLFWVLAGPPLVGIVGLLLAFNKAPLGSVLDFVFLGGLAALIGARLMDRPKSGSTPLDSTDFGSVGPRKYTLWVLLIGGLLFAFAHVIAPRLF